MKNITKGYGDHCLQKKKIEGHAIYVGYGVRIHKCSLMFQKGCNKKGNKNYNKCRRYNIHDDWPQSTLLLII